MRLRRRLNNLQDWLEKLIFPPRPGDRAVACCTDLGLAEMIASGVTCVADMYMRTSIMAQQVAAAGINANLCCGGVLFSDTFDPELAIESRVQRPVTEEWRGYHGGQTWWNTYPSGVHLPGRIYGSGWPPTPKRRAWACISTSPRPAPSTRPGEGHHSSLTPFRDPQPYGVWGRSGHCRPLRLRQPRRTGLCMAEKRYPPSTTPMST